MYSKEQGEKVVQVEMKGVQCRSPSKEQCRDVQADFVCKLEKERVDAFEVYPNTVRLNLLNGM